MITITKKEWQDKPKDYKSVINGQRYVMMMTDKGTALVPVYVKGMRSAVKKIPVSKIILHWYEGRQMKAYPNESVFKNIPEMNRFLASQARKITANGGYDKHKITVVWEDGQTYTGRWDVTNPNSEYYSVDDVKIGAHIKNWFKYQLEKGDLSLKEKMDIEEFLRKYDLSDR